MFVSQTIIFCTLKKSMINKQIFKIVLSVNLFFVSICSSFSQKPIIEWQKNYGGSFYDKAESVIETPDGGLVICGHSQSSNIDLTTNQGDFDFWIIKINNVGVLQWKFSLGGGGSDYLQKVILTPDEGVMCIGYTNSSNGGISNPKGQIDYCVVKLNNVGTLQWKKNYGGTSNDWGQSLCLSGDGGFIIAGYSESNDEDVLQSLGNTDFWILKIDVNGNILWQKSYGGSGYDYLGSIKQTQDGGYVITGNSNSTNDDFIQNKGGYDVWILKIDGLGNIQWKNNFGGTYDDFSNDIIEDNEGNFVLVGETLSDDFDAVSNHLGVLKKDYLVIKTNYLGQKIWSKCFGGEAHEYGRSIILDFDGNYVIGGESYSLTGDPTGNHGSAEYWLIKIAPSTGDLIWEKAMGGLGHDEANCVVATFDNGFVMVGNSAHPISDDVTQNYGDDDFWVVKLKNIDCPNNLSGLYNIPLGDIEFKALQNISVQNKILNSSSNIIYSAGKSVVLNPGFSTVNGSVFTAKIEGCN